MASSMSRMYVAQIQMVLTKLAWQCLFLPFCVEVVVVEVTLVT